ncbi:MAG: FAD-binding domain-containing protein [Cyclobacteriaceae bacterium]
MKFPTKYEKVLKRMEAVDPVKYAKTRNFGDGAVSMLSPYISRGVISTRMVHQHLLESGFEADQMQKFVQELAWRDYWQQVWVAKGNDIDFDLRRTQPDFSHDELPVAMAEGNTGIEVVDEALQTLFEVGYMHNHMRMYVAAITCNVAKSHWKVPAQWLYYHLLDGDWASNGLSWQWVAGANANKKYIANQENINKYFDSSQSGTFLDVSYEALPDIEVPDQLSETFVPELRTTLPESTLVGIDSSKPTLLYNYYNLDPLWHKDEPANRVFLIEPSHFAKYPVSEKCMDFASGLLENIPEITVYVGEFDQFVEEFQPQKIFYKEHPTNRHYEGEEESRDWMFDVKGYYPSFFAFWKKCTKKKSNAREKVA